MPTTRASVYDDWIQGASTDLATNADTHRLVRPSTLGAVSGTGSWRAAATRVDLSRELFRPPAGWSIRAGKGQGWIGHRSARLCVLEDPDGHRVLFATMDALAGSRWLAEALGRRLATHGLDVARVFLGCTHTHGAAGAFFGDLFYDTLGGGLHSHFDQLGCTWLENRLVDAVEGLVPVLEDVSLHSGEGLLAHGQLWQRAIGSYLAQDDAPDQMSAAEIDAASQRAHPPGWEPAGLKGKAAGKASQRAVEPRVPVFALKDASGELLYASGVVHGTGSLLMVGAKLMASDVLGEAAMALERSLSGTRRPVVALMAGAHGDQNVSIAGEKPFQVLDGRAKKSRSEETLGRVALRYIQHAAERIAQDLAPAFQGVTALSATELDVRFAEAFAPGAAVASRAVDLPGGVVPSPLNPRHLPAEWNFGAATTKGSEFSKDDVDKDTLFDLGSRRGINWLGGHVDPVGWSSIATTLAFVGRPRSTVYCPFLPLRLVRLGSLVFVGMPAEPSIRIFDAVKDVLGSGDQVHLAGNVGAFTGYADTIGAALMQEYEGASSYWGRDFGVYLVQQVEALASASSFQRANGVPDDDEWLLGGPMLGAAAVGGSAWFSLSRDRADVAVDKGPGDKLSGRVMGFVNDGKIPVQTPLPSGKALRVRGYWRPRKAAKERSAVDEVSWPRVAVHGPVAVVTLSDGTVLRSDDYPMMLRWDGDLWHVSLEVDVAPASLEVEGWPGVKPIGATSTTYTP